MSETGSLPEAPERVPVPIDHDEPGWLATWVSRDRVRAVAIVLIVLQVGWRAQVALPGYLAIDDFAMATRAAESSLSARYLLELFNNHLMPGGLLATWLMVRGFGLSYGSYVLVLVTAQTVLGIAFFRLLRRLVPSGWGVLVPLIVFLFSPLTLEATSWWSVGVNMLPMQLAMVLAIGAQVKYVRDGRSIHLVTLGLALLLGLFFFEKALLIGPLVFLVTVCFFVTGSPLRAVVRAFRRYLPSWLVIGGISVVYLGLYLMRAQSSLRRPRSVFEVVTFVRELLTSTLLPGLIGGPWRWLGAEDGAPVTAPTAVGLWLALAVILMLVVVTVSMRRIATRAWILLLLYVTMVATLLGATRLGSEFSAAAGLVPRYMSDVVVVAAISIAVALLGLRDAAEPERRLTWPTGQRDRTILAAALTLLLVVLLGSSAFSASKFTDEWAVKRGRDYLRTAEAELAASPPGTVFFDTTVPTGVLGKLSWPYNLQSRFFRPARYRPVFVTQAENLSVFDQWGHVRQAKVDGIKNVPGPSSGCGYRVGGGRTVRIPLAGKYDQWVWAVRIAYISSGDTDAVLRFGNGLHWFRVHRGVGQIFFLIDGSGDAVELTVTGFDPEAGLCTDEIALGEIVPVQSG